MLLRFYNLCIGITIFVILTAFMTGCADDDDPTILTSNYAPIEVGNTWTFIDPEYPLVTGTVSITGTRELSSGKTVFIAIVTDEYSSQSGNFQRGYLSRAANDLLLFHRTLNDLEGELVYKPPIRVGMKWEGEQSHIEIVARETVSTPAGIFQNCFRIEVQIIDRLDNYTTWLANHIGPVKLESEDISLVLTGYNLENPVTTDEGLSRF